jgi:hypothetical protein
MRFMNTRWANTLAEIDLSAANAIQLVVAFGTLHPT